jgi:hypothetical protein
MKIVQFLHPGGEQIKKNGIDWNLGKHKRKFVKTQGSFLDLSNNFSNQTLGFWGECEAPSFVPAVILDKEPNGFARPNIVLDNIITQNHGQGLKLLNTARKKA